jgi:hypothetical protein
VAKRGRTIIGELASGLYKCGGKGPCGTRKGWYGSTISSGEWIEISGFFLRSRPLRFDSHLKQSVHPYFLMNAKCSSLFFNDLVLLSP